MLNFGLINFIFQDQLCLWDYFDTAMVTSPTGKGVIAMGGGTLSESGISYSKAMFELSQSMEWTRLEQTLKIGHFGRPLAIPIPDELVSKQD